MHNSCVCIHNMQRGWFSPSKLPTGDFGFLSSTLKLPGLYSTFRVLHKITVLLTLADCIHFHRRVSKTRRNESLWFGEWKYSGVMLCAVSQGTSPAQWEVSHFVALLEETEEKERESERIWQGYAVNCFFAGGFVFTRSLSPLLAFSLYKDVQVEKA